MKPNSNRTGKKFPVVDFAYQAITLEDYRGGCADIRPPSFRSISNGYFKNEARQSFVSEAVFFGLIVLTSAWPVIQSVRAMIDLVRAFAGY